MKRLLATLAVAVVGFFASGAATAAADPSVTLCHDVHVGVNGSDILDDAACTTAP